jgi:hypothetical protein
MFEERGIRDRETETQFRYLGESGGTGVSHSWPWHRPTGVPLAALPGGADMGRPLKEFL